MSYKLARIYDMTNYTGVRKAASALKGLLREPDWLIDIRPQFTSKLDGDAILVVRVRWQFPHILASIPNQVNGIRVVVKQD